MLRPSLRLASLFLVLALAACPRARFERTYPEPGADAVLAYLSSLRERVKTLRAETLSDARIGKERANVTVLILAAWGGKLRYQAMNPGNAAMAADLASDGVDFCFVDANHNCGGCGPATPENVGSLIQVTMPPDDVVAMMMGGTPLLPDATPVLSWNEGSGEEILTLTRTDGLKQKIVLDGKDRRWDVLVSELTDAKGKLVYRIRHKDFHGVKNAAGETLRLPGKSFFEQPGNDVLIRWKEQELDVELDEAKFRIDLQPGLPTCGQEAK